MCKRQLKHGCIEGLQRLAMCISDHNMLKFMSMPVPAIFVKLYWYLRESIDCSFASARRLHIWENFWACHVLGTTHDCNWKSSKGLRLHICDVCSLFQKFRSGAAFSRGDCSGDRVFFFFFSQRFHIPLALDTNTGHTLQPHFIVLTNNGAWGPSLSRGLVHGRKHKIGIVVSHLDCPFSWGSKRKKHHKIYRALTGHVICSVVFELST